MEDRGGSVAIKLRPGMQEILPSAHLVAQVHSQNRAFECVCNVQGSVKVYYRR